MSGVIQWRWAVRTLNPKSENDKKAIDHLKAGCFYYFLNEIKPFGYSKPLFLVGYKHIAGPLSHGSEWATPGQIAKLDKLDKARYSSR